jgi:hypothetical protein
LARHAHDLRTALEQLVHQPAAGEPRTARHQDLTTGPAIHAAHASAAAMTQPGQAVADDQFVEFLLILVAVE